MSFATRRSNGSLSRQNLWSYIDQAAACFPEFIGHSPRVSARRLHCGRKNFAKPIGRETYFAFGGMRRADSLLEVERGRVVIGREVGE